MSIKITLHHIADLSEPDQQKLISTDYQALTGNWINGLKPAPTQQLGAAMYAIPKLEGFLYPSAQVNSRNLAIFMDKLDPNSKITFRNEILDKDESIE